jgi:hypothetical protein
MCITKEIQNNTTIYLSRLYCPENEGLLTYFCEKEMCERYKRKLSEPIIKMQIEYPIKSFVKNNGMWEFNKQKISTNDEISIELIRKLIQDEKLCNIYGYDIYIDSSNEIIWNFVIRFTGYEQYMFYFQAKCTYFGFYSDDFINNGTGKITAREI